MEMTLVQRPPGQITQEKQYLQRQHRENVTDFRETGHSSVASESPGLVHQGGGVISQECAGER